MKRSRTVVHPLAVLSLSSPNISGSMDIPGVFLHSLVNDIVMVYGIGFWLGYCNYSLNHLFIYILAAPGDDFQL